MNLGLAGVIGSGISALGGIFSGSSSYRNQKKLLRQQNEYNTAAAELAYQRNLDMWNRQNAYNSPKEQMQRLRDAGLNPNLMYGQGNTGNASSAPDYNPAMSEINRYNGDFGIQQAANGVSNAINTYISTQQQLAAIRRSDSDTAKNNADTNLRLLQAIGQQRKNAKSSIELRYLDDIQRQTLENMEATNMNIRANSQFVDQRRLQFEAERPLRTSMLEENLSHIKFINQLNPLTKRHLLYRILNLQSQYSGRELENHITRTLVNTGVNLRGGALERGVTMIMDALESDDFDLSTLGKSLAVGAIGFLTK